MRHLVRLTCSLAAQRRQECLQGATCPRGQPVVMQALLRLKKSILPVKAAAIHAASGLAPRQQQRRDQIDARPPAS